jgi:predicted aspartyl protease
MRNRESTLGLLMLLLLLTASVSQAEPVNLPLELANSGNFYLHGTLLEEVDTDLLVDTGSGYVSLGSRTFNRIRRLPGTEYLRDIQGTLANGNTLRIPIYRVAELMLNEDCVLRNIEVAVFLGADRDILGLNALRRMQPFTLQMDPPTLIATQCRES